MTASLRQVSYLSCHLAVMHLIYYVMCPDNYYITTSIFKKEVLLMLVLCETNSYSEADICCEVAN